jgi:hypothetical protein
LENVNLSTTAAYAPWVLSSGVTFASRRRKEEKHSFLPPAPGTIFQSRVEGSEFDLLAIPAITLYKNGEELMRLGATRERLSTSAYTTIEWMRSTTCRNHPLDLPNISRSNQWEFFDIPVSAYSSLKLSGEAEMM